LKDDDSDHEILAHGGKLSVNELIDSIFGRRFASKNQEGHFDDFDSNSIKSELALSIDEE